jgi:Spy/CpxP family protein refolding chaperone
MKTAYELAMERLSRTAPTVRLTDQQKQAIAELESKYKARVAQREIVLRGEIGKAAAGGDAEAVEKLEQQLAAERRSIQAELEEKKASLRQSA